MANILYGINGEGAGHSTRSRQVIEYLHERGHRVIAASFDRGLANLRDACETIEIHGFRFTYVNNQVRYESTALKNIFKSGKAAASLLRLRRLIRERDICLVITDFEPFTCRAARLARIPLLSIDNQHMMTNTAVKTPKEFRRDAAAARLVTRFMTPGADEYLVTSFFEAPVKKRDTIIVPPILRREIIDATPWDAGKILVYVTSPSRDLIETLRKVRAEFICYGFGRSGREANITFKEPSLAGFAADLVAAHAVIANAGFSLLTESLYLGKPFLAVPVRHQFEQQFNAYWLQQTGYGAYWEQPNKEQIESFLYNLPEYQQKLRQYPRNGNTQLYAALDSALQRLLGSVARKAHS